MLKIIYLLLFLLIVVFVNSQELKFKARDVKTLIVFTFDNTTDFDSQTITSYIDYFTEFVNIWNVGDITELDNLPLELHFGSFNATNLLYAANDDNDTIAMIILKNNQEFIDNVSIEAIDPLFNKNAKCDTNSSTDPKICKFIDHFINMEKDPLTKLTFVIFSNICPDPSILKSMHDFDNEENSPIKTLNSIFVSKTNQSCQGFKHQIKIPNSNKAELNDTRILVDPTFDFSETANKYIFLLIKNENYLNSITFLYKYYGGLCKGNKNDSYLLTMRRYISDNYSEYQEISKSFLLSWYYANLQKRWDYHFQVYFHKNVVYLKFAYYPTFATVDSVATYYANFLATALPSIDFEKYGINVENYLKQNLDYHFFRNEAILGPQTSLKLENYLPNKNFTHIILFSDHYSEEIKNGLFVTTTENRTFDFILFNANAGDRESQAFYEQKDNKYYKSNFMRIPDSKSWDICYPISRLTEGFQWGLYGGIAGGLIVIFVVGITFYFKCLRRRNNPFYIIVDNYQNEDKKDFKKDFGKLNVDIEDVHLDFNTIEGIGVSSTVYRSEVKRRALSMLSRKSMDKNASETHTVAAKLLNQLEKEEIDEVIGEIEAARKLEKHENICILLGVTYYQEAPCLLYEWMEMSLLGYIKSLRIEGDDTISERGSTIAVSSAGESEVFGVPDFDDKQQQIFLQILLQVTRGLDHIASKNIVHRDVAARNILISRYGDTFTAKVADFGLCVDIDESSNIYRSSLNKRLPIKWLALECHIDRTFSQASDVWAFGVTMIEVYSLSGPLYPGIGLNEIPEHLKQGKRLEKPEKMEQNVYDIAFNCWNENPYLRPMFSELTGLIEKLLRDNNPYSYENRGYWYVEDEVWQTIPLTNDQF